MFAAIKRIWFLWNADAIRAERESYQQAGAIGPEYLANSLAQEADYLRKLKELS